MYHSARCTVPAAAAADPIETYDYKKKVNRSIEAARLNEGCAKRHVSGEFLKPANEQIPREMDYKIAYKIDCIADRSTGALRWLFCMQDCVGLNYYCLYVYSRMHAAKR